MKLVWHIVWKDFLRLRWGLAAWWAVIALKLGLGFALILFLGDAQWTQSGQPHPFWSDNWLGTTLPLIALLEGFLAFFLTAMLVKEDGLVGTKQFWITRPISPGRLLAAKCAGWVLMLWLSAVVLILPWWLACGFGAGQIAWAALELFAFQAAISLPAAVVASLTDTVSRVVVWSLVLVAFVGMAIPAILGLLTARAILGTNMPEFAGICFVALAVVGAAIFARQYWRRNWVGSVVRLGLGILAGPVVLILLVVRFDGTFRRIVRSDMSWSDWHEERAADVSLRQQSAVANPTNLRREELVETQLTTYLAASGVPRGYVVMQGDKAQQTWRWPDGLEVRRNEDWIGGWGADGALRVALGVGERKRDEETERYWQTQREADERKRAKEYLDRVRATSAVYRAVPTGITVSSMVMPSTIKRMMQTPPSYQATVQLRLTQPEPWIEIPYAASGWHAHAGYGFRLGNGTVDGDGARAAKGGFVDEPGVIAFPIVATMENSVWDEIFSAQHWMRDRWKEPGFYIINRAGGDLLRQNVYRTPRIRIAGVGVVRDVVRAWVPILRRDGKAVPRDPHWRDEAKFVLVGVREEARFTREVKAEKFEIAK